MTINEDFLKSEMTTSGWTLPPDPDYKQLWQEAWDDDWDIDSNNYRELADRHVINPQTTPWAQMDDGDTFQIIQRMRVKSTCISENNEGPWFATHTILFKQIDGQYIEVYPKKSGVQGTGDPQI